MSDDRRPDLAELVEAYHADLYRYALRLSGSVADAEDLTQQAYLQAHGRLDQLRDPEAARAWLMAILRNCYLRQQRRPSEAVTIEPSLDCFPDPADKGSDDEIDQEALTAALAELPEEFRVVLLLYYFEGFSYRRIAEELGLPPGTVMSRLSRAKSHLRRRLAAHGVVAPAPHGQG